MDIGGFALWRKKASSRQSGHVVQSRTFVTRAPKFRALERVVLDWVRGVGFGLNLSITEDATYQFWSARPNA